MAENEKKPLLTEDELARREAALAAREAALAAQEQSLAAQQEEQKRRGLLDNGNPNYVNPKEKMYDHIHVSVRTMDIIIGVLLALILLFLVLGMTHTSFFGLF